MILLEKLLAILSNNEFLLLLNSNIWNDKINMNTYDKNGGFSYVAYCGKSSK
jgi:hypothetical protein